MSGTLFVTAKSGEDKPTAPAVMLVEWPDKVRLELQDPVGSTLSLLVVNGDRFWFYAKNLPEIVTGPLRRLPARLAMAAGGEEFVRGLLARPPLESWTDPVLEGKEIQRANGDRVVWSSRLGEPEKWTAVKPKGVVDTFEYEDYETKSGISFPKKIRVTHLNEAGESELAVFDWRDWQPFVPQEKKLFQIPQQQTFGRKIKALH